MSERYTIKDAEKAMDRLCEELGKPRGHYRTLEPGEVSSIEGNTRITTIPGGWALDYNPIYGGCVVEEIAPDGHTWVSQPFGSTRRSPREFCQMVNDVLRARSLESA